MSKLPVGLPRLALVLVLAIAANAHAQVGVLSPEEAVRSGPRLQTSGRQASQDPRDFEGSYRAAQFQNPGAGNARGSAGASGGAGGGGPPAGYVPPSGPYTSANCVPSFGAFGGGPEGSMRVMQTAGQLTVVSEEMHNVRRIYIDQDHPKDFRGSYSGDSVAHWEGDVLVIDVTGIRRVGAADNAPSTGRRERLRKLPDGSLEHTQSVVDAAGVAGAPRTTAFSFVGEQQILEWICEDLGEVYFNDAIKL